MISLVGTPSPDLSAIGSAIAAITGKATSLEEIVPDSTVSLIVTGWSPEEIAELIAPLADRRIAVDAAAYLDGVSALHRLATHLDGDDLTPDPRLVALQDALADQLRRDCAVPEVWNAWAVAAWAEDDAERPTISARTLRWLTRIQDAAGVAATHDASVAHHAGALHTYGYLCSSLWTKYGWKRTRWVGGGIAAAAGVDPTLLQPVPPSGTLLSNATALADHLLGWSRLPDRVRNEEVRPTAQLLGRIVEVATPQKAIHDDGAALAEPIEIRSSLFRRTDPPPNLAPNLLVYTIVQDGSERLVTMFDISDAKAAELLNPPAHELGDQVAIRLRYNAVVVDAGARFIGSRHIETSRGQV